MGSVWREVQTVKYLRLVWSEMVYSLLFFNQTLRAEISFRPTRHSKNIASQFSRAVAGVVHENGVGIAFEEIFVHFLGAGFVVQVPLGDFRFAERCLIEERAA